MQAYALTDIGRRRHINQDYIYASTKAVGAFPNLFILADGMGGHRAGDFASRYLVETLVGYVSKNTVDEPVKVMNNAIMLSNAMIYHKSLEDEELMGMGSTGLWLSWPIGWSAATVLSVVLCLFAGKNRLLRIGKFKEKIV